MANIVHVQCSNCPNHSVLGTEEVRRGEIWLNKALLLPKGWAATFHPEELEVRFWCDKCPPKG